MGSGSPFDLSCSTHGGGRAIWLEGCCQPRPLAPPLRQWRGGRFLTLLITTANTVRRSRGPGAMCLDEGWPERACKPDSVRRASKKRPARCGDHSSRSRLAPRLQQPTRGFCRAGPALPSYLALHHAGFSVPPVSPPERWALTPPFHPYLRSVRSEDVSKVFL